MDAVGAEVFVEVDDHLRVAVGRERMTTAPKFFAQLLVVVDLTVVHDDDRVVLVEDGLVAGLEVDDAKPLDAEADAFVDEESP